MNNTVYFYKDIALDEVFVMCKLCAKKQIKMARLLEQIQKAGDCDECVYCEAQNLPTYDDYTVMTPDNRS